MRKTHQNHDVFFSEIFQLKVQGQLSIPGGGRKCLAQPDGQKAQLGVTPPQARQPWSSSKGRHQSRQCGLDVLGTRTRQQLVPRKKIIDLDLIWWALTCGFFWFLVLFLLLLELEPFKLTCWLIFELPLTLCAESRPFGTCWSCSLLATVFALAPLLSHCSGAVLCETEFHHIESNKHFVFHVRYQVYMCGSSRIHRSKRYPLHQNAI